MKNRKKAKLTSPGHHHPAWGCKHWTPLSTETGNRALSPGKAQFQMQHPDEGTPHRHTSPCPLHSGSSMHSAELSERKRRGIPPVPLPPKDGADGSRVRPSLSSLTPPSSQDFPRCVMGRGAESCAIPTPPPAGLLPHLLWKGGVCGCKVGWGWMQFQPQSRAPWLEAIFSLGPQACLPVGSQPSLPSCETAPHRPPDRPLTRTGNRTCTESKGRLWGQSSEVGCKERVAGTKPGPGG